jgi:hypothetical protein
MLDIACRVCDRRSRLRVARLLAEYGPGIGLPQLAAILSADCPAPAIGVGLMGWTKISAAYCQGVRLKRTPQGFISLTCQPSYTLETVAQFLRECWSTVKHRQNKRLRRTKHRNQETPDSSGPNQRRSLPFAQLARSFSGRIDEPPTFCMVIAPSQIPCRNVKHLRNSEGSVRWLPQDK